MEKIENLSKEIKDTDKNQIENLSKEIKDTDKNQMENFKMQSTIAKAKHSLDVFKKQNGEGREKNQ